MRAFSKPILVVVTTVIIIVAGFFFLLRGCLSRYDERSALPQVLYFEKDGKQVIFSVVKFEKATSYSSKNGMTSKSVSTNYFIQTNDAATGKKISDQKIKHHRDIKNFPVRIMGAADNKAWVFMGEPMAFDPFTLKTVADIELLEQKNPSLKGKFPAEERYYEFNPSQHTLYFTAVDGSPWKVDSRTLIAATAEEGEGDDEKELDALEKLITENRVATDSLMQQKLRRPSQQLQAKEISMSEYHRISKSFNEERTALYKVRDSLYRLKSTLAKTKRDSDDIRRKIQSLSGENNTSFSQIKTNQDTLHGKWYGLYSKQEMDKLYDRVQNQQAYDEKARRQLFVTNYAPGRNDDFKIDKENAASPSSVYFLDGGFLLNRETGLPIAAGNSSYLVVYKNQIGNEGKIQVSRLSTNGKQVWAFDSGLKDWGSYLYTGKWLILTGTNNKELSSSDANLLICLDLEQGKAVTYDFFSDK